MIISVEFAKALMEDRPVSLSDYSDAQLREELSRRRIAKNIERAARQRRKHHNERLFVGKMVADGADCQELAKIYGVSHATIYSMFEEYAKSLPGYDEKRHRELLIQPNMGKLRATREYLKHHHSNRLLTEAEMFQTLKEAVKGY